MDVSYAGQKDRNAVTTQWFSVRIPGLTEPDWQQFNSDQYQVLDAARHGRKLRRGSLKANSFSVVIRNLKGEQQLLEERLCKIKENGVPNYFGEQRFGHNGDNLVLADMMLVEGKKIKNRQKRSMCISAARSYLFNLVCSERVARGNWNKALEGDALILSGTHSFFVPDSIDDEIQRRIDERDIMPSGPLWGRGKLPVHSQALMTEQDVLAPYAKWCEGLEKLGLKQERRSLWLPVDNLQWEFSHHSVELKFMLPSGSYATSVIREVLDYYEHDV
jgi:tRNA pseudouridine13 synthase